MLWIIIVLARKYDSTMPALIKERIEMAMALQQLPQSIEGSVTAGSDEPRPSHTA
jgi:hypothetical protein